MISSHNKENKISNMIYANTKKIPNVDFSSMAVDKIMFRLEAHIS